MSLNKLSKTLLTISAVVFLFGSGYKLGQYKAQTSPQVQPDYQLINTDSPPVEEIDFSLFWDVWEKLKDKYVDKEKLETKEMFYGSIKGLVKSLDDPYTFFLTPEENEKSKEGLEGKFEGIGAQLGLKDGQIVIVAPLKNSPAEKAGVIASDIILAVDGESTENWTLSEAVSNIRGPKGSKVTLTLFRGESEFEVEITRGEIKVPSVELELEKDVAIIKLIQFGDATPDEWDKKIDQVVSLLKEGKIKGAVLDLRDNPGGYLQGAVYVATEFLPRGKMIVTQEYLESPPDQYKVQRLGKLLDIPLIVLINQGSASASEIVAGALRDHQRAKLVGEKTFGKGSIQEALDLKGGAGLHVTIAKWVLPAGDWINGKGVEPEIKVENKIEEGNTLTRKDDKQLDRAIEEVLK